MSHELLTTTACGGAPGVAKPGFGPIVTLGSDALVALLTGATDGVAAVALSIVLGGLQFNLDEQCASGDPGDPGMTQQDWADLANFYNIVTFGAVVPKARQWLIHNLWPVWCDCSDGTSVPPPAITGVPNGTGNPGMPQAPLGANCWDSTVTRRMDPSALFAEFNDVLPQVPPFSGFAPNEIPSIQSPTPASFVISVTNHNDTLAGTSSSVFGTVAYLDSVGGHLTAQNTATVAPGAPTTSSTFTIPTSAVWWSVTAQSVGGATTPSQNVTVEFTIFCQGQSPTIVQTPCCPPDPSIDGKLSLILQLLLPTPAGYKRGTVHSALTGSGTLTVSGLFGVLVELTSGVPTTPQLPGVPPYQFSVGWVSCLTPDGMIDEIRITRQSQVWASRLAPFATQFGYQLNAGFTANITELVPA